MKKLIDPRTLTREELIQIVLNVQGVLYPDDDLEYEWSTSELEDISRLVTKKSETEKTEAKPTLTLTEERKEAIRADFLAYSGGHHPNEANDELMLYIKHLNWRLSVTFKAHEDELGTFPEDVEDFLLEWADED